MMKIYFMFIKIENNLAKKVKKNHFQISSRKPAKIGFSQNPKESISKISQVNYESSYRIN